MIKIYHLEKEEIPFYVGKAKDYIRRKGTHKITYGKDIKLIIIDEVEDNDWKFWEKHYISLYKSWGFILTNKNGGGGGPTFYTEEQKDKMRKPRKEGTGAKISKTLLEGNHSQYYTKEVRQKQSENMSGRSNPFTQEHIDNLAKAQLNRAFTVIQMDLQENFIREWKSKGLAAKWIKEQTGKTSNIMSQIKDCILGKQKTAHGYKWKYKE